jgi:hypothetical protein
LDAAAEIRTGSFAAAEEAEFLFDAGDGFAGPLAVELEFGEGFA